MLTVYTPDASGKQTGRIAQNSAPNFFLFMMTMFFKRIGNVGRFPLTPKVRGKRTGFRKRLIRRKASGGQRNDVEQHCKKMKGASGENKEVPNGMAVWQPA